MAKPKVRNYPSIEDYEKIFEDYFRSNKGAIMQYVCHKFQVEDEDSLKEQDFGFDCGWVHLFPRDPEMAKEWKLDNGDYGARIFDIASKCYGTQSITIKEVILEKAVEDLNLDDVFHIRRKYD